MKKIAVTYENGQVFQHFGHTQQFKVYEIEEVHHDNRRWSRVECRYLQIDDRYFCFSADMGLTECQDNTYWIQPHEVKRTQKTVVVNVWEEIPRD